MPGPSERRQFTRIAFDASASLIDPADNRQWQTKLIDISLKGVLIQRPDHWQETESRTFILQLLLSDAAVLRFEVRVIHQDNERIGLLIEHLDLDSATHLHRLLELNLGDSALLERELTELLNPDL